VTDGDAIHAKILAEPDEDLHRLAYADWLDEQGEHARAEFIRVGCELARTPETVEVVEDWPVEAVDGDTVRLSGAGFGADAAVTYALRGDTLTTTRRAVNPEYKRLCDRRNELCGPANCRLGAWLDDNPLPAVSGHTGVSWRVMEGGGTRSHIRAEFRRGFVERVTCAGGDWARHGDAVLAAHPVRRVTFTDNSLFVAAWDVDYRRRLIRYYVAGRLVDMPAPTEGQTRNHDDAVRLALSARWPRVPPEGWTFAPARSEWSLPPGGWQVAPPGG